MFARILLISALSLLLPSVVFAECMEVEPKELTENIAGNSLYLDKLKTYEACLQEEHKNKFNAERVKQYKQQIAERDVLLERIEKIKENEKYTFAPLKDELTYGDGLSMTDEQKRLNAEYERNSSREKAAAAKRLGLDN